MVRKIIGRTLRLLLVAPICLVWYTTCAIIINAQPPRHSQADAAIVLGAAVYGVRPSPLYRARLEHAVALYQEGVVPKLIFTGGVGWRDTVSEAEVGREFALAHGIPESAILIEPTSTSTRENLYHLLPLLQEQQINKVAIVTTPFHIKRSLFIARHYGLDAVGAPTFRTVWLPNGTRHFLFVREVFAVLHHLLLWSWMGK